MSVPFSLSRLDEDAAVWCSILAAERASSRPWAMKVPQQKDMSATMQRAFRAFRYVVSWSRKSVIDEGGRRYTAWAEAEAILRGGIYRPNGRRLHLR